MIDLNESLAELPPPVYSVAGDVGLGKTRALREHVVPPLIALGMRVVLAVPRHRLGDEIVADLAKAGIAALEA